MAPKGVILDEIERVLCMYKRYSENVRLDLHFRRKYSIFNMIACLLVPRCQVLVPELAPNCSRSDGMN